jgi:hypothetical protein
MMARKVQTVAELDAALRESDGRPGSICLYVREDLLDAARETVGDDAGRIVTGISDD